MNLKKVNYTISNEKFQFYIINFKIIDFIYDLNIKFFKMIKIIKILK